MRILLKKPYSVSYHHCLCPSSFLYYSLYICTSLDYHPQLCQNWVLSFSLHLQGQKLWNSLPKDTNCITFCQTLPSFKRRLHVICPRLLSLCAVSEEAFLMTASWFVKAPFAFPFVFFASTQHQMYASYTSTNPLQPCLVFYSFLNLLLKTSFCVNFYSSYNIILSHLVKHSIQRNMIKEVGNKKSPQGAWGGGRNQLCLSK